MNRTTVVVALPLRQVLRKELVLPAAVEQNLRQTLAYDLDRHTPFRPDQVYFDAVVSGRDATKKTIRVDWTAALKTVVDGARRQAEAWGACGGRRDARTGLRDIAAVEPAAATKPGRRASSGGAGRCGRRSRSWWRCWRSRR